MEEHLFVTKDPDFSSRPSTALFSVHFNTTPMLQTAWKHCLFLPETVYTNCSFLSDTNRTADTMTYFKTAINSLELNNISPKQLRPDNLFLANSFNNSYVMNSEIFFMSSF